VRTINDKKCPKCGSPEAVEIVYGMPTEETFRKADKGLVELGGCCQEVGAPNHVCKGCGWRWSE